MYFIGIMAENLGMNRFGMILAMEDDHQQHQQQRTVIHYIALPGFRFNPTEEELVDYYLRRMVQGKRNSMELIASIDLYRHDPWELPALAFMGEKEWFFFCPRDRKYPNGARPNRVTTSGYWKATGTDRAVRCTTDNRCIGLKKTLVFYTGRAPRGNKTDWIMNEYRMPNPLDESNTLASQGTSASMFVAGCNITMTQSGCEKFTSNNDVTLCRIYRKSSSLSSVGAYLDSAPGEDFARSRSRDQHLVSTLMNSLPANAQRRISSSSQRQLLDFPAQSLQGSTTSAAAAAISSSSTSHNHQEFALTENSLLSSHAVMARLLEETCRYDDPSGPSVISHKSNSPSKSADADEGLTRHLQNATGMGASKIEGYAASIPKTNINIDCSQQATSHERVGTFTDLFEQFRHVRHLDCGASGDLL